MHSIAGIGFGLDRIQQSRLFSLWLSANCVETTVKTDEILYIFSLRTKQQARKKDCHVIITC